MKKRSSPAKNALPGKGRVKSPAPVLAVIFMMIRAICDRVEDLKPVGQLLGD